MPLGRDANSKTLPFPLALVMFSKLFVPESVSELELTVMSGVSVVVEVREGGEEMDMSVSVSVEEVSVISEYLVANCAAILMTNERNFKSVYEAEII